MRSSRTFLSKLALGTLVGPLAIAGSLACGGAGEAGPASKGALPQGLGQNNQATSRAAPADVASGLSFRDPVVSGTLCDGILSVGRSGTTLDVILSSPFFEVQPHEEPTCKVVVELEVPEGYAVGLPHVALSGGASDVDIVRSYSFDGVGTKGPLRSRVELIGGHDYQLVEQPFHAVFSDTCGSSHVARWVMEVRPVFVSSSSELTLERLVLDVSPGSGVDWRACGDDTPLTSPSAKRGQSCAGLGKIECAEGLACERHFLDEGQPGICVDPSEKVSPAALGGVCGGVRDIPCGPRDSLCVFQNQQAAEQKITGQCFPAIIGENQECAPGSYPARPCAEGLSCLYSQVDERSRCRALNGAKGSPCGEGVGQCAAGLFCDANNLCSDAPAWGSAGLDCRKDSNCREPLVCVFDSPTSRSGRCGNPKVGGEDAIGGEDATPGEEVDTGTSTWSF